MDMPAGTSIIGFADDALVVCAADNVGILEVRINDSLWRAKRWLDSRDLGMAPEKTEALLVTDRRSFTYPKIPELATWLNREHGEVGFYLTQALSGHGCFNAYLRRLKKRDEEMCCYCDFPVDNAEHALFVCAKWGVEREALGQAVGAKLTPDTMVFLMLQSERNWTLIKSFVTLVMKMRELDGCREHNNREAQ